MKLGTYLNCPWIARQRRTRFAVHRDRIRAHPREKYEILQKRILEKDHDHARRHCGALENIWHAIFGEPPRLSAQSSVVDLH